MTSGEALKQWRASRAGHFLLALLLLAATAFAIYARTTAFGLFADDYQWLGGARDFDVGRVWAFTSRTHFYRPLVDLYFRGAFILCGPSASCYHWLSLGLHVTTSLLVAALAAVVSGNPAIGLAAGVLFAAQPAPTEAVTWVSAVSEVLVTAFFVLTLLLFRSANASGRQAPYWFAVLTFTACLLTHESGVTLLPVMLLSTLLQNRGAGLTARPLKWVPFAVVWLAYGLVAYVVNSRNYLIAEGRYEIGPHMAINVIDALVSLSVARRELPGLVVMAMAFAWAVALAPGRIRFFAAWILDYSPAGRTFSLSQFALSVPSRRRVRAARSGAPVVGAWGSRAMVSRGVAGLVVRSALSDGSLWSIRGQERPRAGAGTRAVRPICGNGSGPVPGPAARRPARGAATAGHDIGHPRRAAAAMDLQRRIADRHRATGALIAGDDSARSCRAAPTGSSGQTSVSTKPRSRTHQH